MSFSCGIVGLPNVGKSSLFNALTKAGANVSNYPFTTIDPNVGIVNVSDERLDKLYSYTKSAKKVPTTIKYIDIAGLVKNAHKGEGLGNLFLSHIQEVDAIIHVVRFFEETDITHVYGNIDPKRDIDIVIYELIFKDLEIIENNLQKLVKKANTGDKKAGKEVEIMEKMKSILEDGKILWKQIEKVFDVEDLKLAKEISKRYGLLTVKPALIVANIGEEQIGNEEIIKELMEYTKTNYSIDIIVPISIELEMEAMEMGQDGLEILKDYGIEKPGIYKLIDASYKLLDLITFYTFNEKETRAWTLKNGSKAIEAAEMIHTDIAKGFIKAEVINFSDLEKINGNLQKAQEEGLIRFEGKDYIVKDGDIIYFRFKV